MTTAPDETPVELTAPDLSPWAAGNGGIPYAWSVEGPAPGPHAMILALVHGNELCGAIAVDRLLRQGFRPARGRLTLAFANLAAYHRFDPANPTASRFVDEDFNRVWDPATLDGPRHSVELQRARELRPLIDTVDLLLDLHSMQHATAPLTLAGLQPKGTDLARAIQIPELVVQDGGHAAGRRLRDYNRFDDPADPAAAILIECGQHWEQASAAVAHDACARFLGAIGMGPAVTAPAPPQRVIAVTDAVTVTSDRFAFAQPYVGLEVIAAEGTVIAMDGARPIRTPYPDCILIMPSRRLTKGLTAVRLGRFVG